MERFSIMEASSSIADRLILHIGWSTSSARHRLLI